YRLAVPQKNGLLKGDPLHYNREDRVTPRSAQEIDDYVSAWLRRSEHGDPETQSPDPTAYLQEHPDYPFMSPYADGNDVDEMIEELKVEPLALRTLSGPPIEITQTMETAHVDRLRYGRKPVQLYDPPMLDDADFDYLDLHMM